MEGGWHEWLSVGRLALKNIIFKLENPFSHKLYGVRRWVRAHWKGKKVLYMLEKESLWNDVFKMSKNYFLYDCLEFFSCIGSMGLEWWFRVFSLGLQKRYPTIIQLCHHQVCHHSCHHLVSHHSCHHLVKCLGQSLGCLHMSSPLG